ncbi:MAG: PilZ domain-containing protein [Phycisphaerae bacterium]|nr:PilZ domain-containing protein [Phycisphaerae bacterium]
MFIESSEDIVVLPGRSMKRDTCFPAEVEMILSAMAAGREAYRREHGDDLYDRRSNERQEYHVRASLRLFSDRPGAAPWLLYVRDADSRGLGFITPHRLPLGYGGNVELAASNGLSICVPCTICRCREAVQGWYEGALNFNREQPDFTTTH